MRINFRQGLVSSELDVNGNPAYLTRNNNVGVTLRTTNRPIMFTAASNIKNYTISYYQDVLAWPAAMLVGVNQAWLYIDLNRTTSAASYGFTTSAPTYGPVAPTNAADSQHWFDTSKNVMKVYNLAAQSWLTVIRVFAAKYTSTSIEAYHIGSQVGINGTTAVTGSIMLDGFGGAIKDSVGNFVTTEDVVFIDGAPTYAAKLESNVTIAPAGETIPTFHVVSFNNLGQVILANYNQVGTNTIGISVEDADVGEPLNVVLSGKVYNPNWNWIGPNVTLWVNSSGTLVTTDPFTSGPNLVRKAPVARTIDAHTIVFDPGLGIASGRDGKDGEDGKDGTSPELIGATVDVAGVTKLSVAPIDPRDPIVVGINDPILTNPRPPTAHTHPATEVTVAPFPGFTGGTAQQALEHLEGGFQMSYVRYTLSSASVSVSAGFNALSPAQRTIGKSTIVIVEWSNTIYLWTGGPGSPAVATNDSQFAVLGKLTTPTSIKVVKAYTAYTPGA